MFSVIDCGTTFSRVYIIDDNRQIIADASTKIGVRDMVLNGTKDILKSALIRLFHEALEKCALAVQNISFAIASGMITSEIGLIEIPHITAPAGIEELYNAVVAVNDPEVLPIGVPVYFVPGVKNKYRKDAGAYDLMDIDFMRGEEVQCVGILKQDVSVPCSIVTLSSHTKVIYIDENRKIAASNTTISGQLYDAILNHTSIGKSLVENEDEPAGGYTYQELIQIACDCVAKTGLGRTLMMPRFMQVLIQSNVWERKVFTNAAIAADDMKAFEDMRRRGLANDRYIIYGQENRCEMYQWMLRKFFGDSLKITCISDRDQIAKLTVMGCIAVAERGAWR